MSRFEVGHIYLVTDGRLHPIRTPKGLLQMKVMMRSEDTLGVVMMHDGMRGSAHQPVTMLNIAENDIYESVEVYPNAYSSSNNMVM